MRATMAEIVRLSEYRRRRRAPAPHAAPSGRAQEAEPHYFCLRCDTDRFRLFPSGAVRCAHCGALMRNITARDSDKGKTGAN